MIKTTCKKKNQSPTVWVSWSPLPDLLLSKYRHFSSTYKYTYLTDEKEKEEVKTDN